MAILGVVPALNEAATIGEVIHNLRGLVDEVLVIDDGSRDSTARVARKAGAVVLSHPANLGIGKALMSGYHHAVREGVEIVVQQDADGQHDSSYVPEMISCIKEGNDLVVASRYLDPVNREPIPWRDAGIRFYSRLLSLLTFRKVTDTTSGFRAIRTKCLTAASTLPPRHWAIYQTLDFIKTGFKYAEIPARMRPRRTGDSQFSFGTMALYHLRVSRSVVGQLLGRRNESTQWGPEPERGGAGYESSDRPKLSS